MVLFALWPVEEETEVQHSYILGAMHRSMKNCQLGLLGGFAAGILMGLRKPGVTPQHMAYSMTKWMGYGASAGIAYGPFDWFWTCMQYSWPQNQAKVFEIQKSIWHNRLDTLTILGAIAGQVFMKQSRIGTSLFGFKPEQVAFPYQGAIWGAFAGTCFDLPLCIFYPVYVANGEEIDVILRHVTRVPDEEEDE